MANVIMGHAFDIPQTHRQHWLSAIQGLNLAFLVDAQDEGVVWRVEIQADNVANFFDEERIGGEFEAARPMRLYREGLKQPVHGGFGNAARLGG